MDRKVLLAVVQFVFQENTEDHKQNIKNLVQEAALKHAQIVLLPELTLYRYMGDKTKEEHPEIFNLAEDINDSVTVNFCKELAKENKLHVVGSLYEKSKIENKDRYFNTSVIASPTGEIFVTRKQHIPSGIGYNEVDWFEPGDSDYPVHDLGFIKVAVPTCYDQWFPELARILSLKGAELILYPSAIGSEPCFKDLDTKPMWQTIMISHTIANGVFIGASNRAGLQKSEEKNVEKQVNVNFYGSSFICQPGGKLLAEASRDKSEVIVSVLDFNEFEQWRKAFPLLWQRQPKTYGRLLEGPIMPNPSL
ncbi:hypothetical protein ABK040_007155 [Willaertia magna]